MDTYSHEQNVYDKAMATLQSIVESMPAIDTLQKEKAEEVKKIDIDLYRKLVYEYGRLLEHVKQSGNASELINSSAQQVSTVLSETLTDAYFDELTGVFSRKYLYENLEYVLDSMQYSDDVLSVVSVSIDHFEDFAIERGQKVTEDCIRSIALTLKNCLFHGNDFVSHLGNGKFMIVLPHTKKDGVRQVAERIRGQIKQLQIINVANVADEFITVSIGCITGIRGRSAWTIQGFVMCAEEALHLAKSNGGNRYVYQSVKPV